MQWKLCDARIVGTDTTMEINLYVRSCIGAMAITGNLLRKTFAQGAKGEKMADDLIRRQEAIEALGEEPMVWLENDGYELGLNNQWNYDVTALRAVSPSQQWIPVTERLPKLGEKVLVSTKHTVFTQVFKCIHGTPDRWGWEHNSIKKVTAWMPLPEPYKEGE